MVHNQSENPKTVDNGINVQAGVETCLDISIFLK